MTYECFVIVYKLIHTRLLLRLDICWLEGRGDC